MKNLLHTAVFALLTSTLVSAVAQVPEARAWQQLNHATADQVFSQWGNPPSEYGPEPYYGLNGPFDIESVRRDLDKIKSLGFRAVTVQYGFGSTYKYLSPEYFEFFRSLVAEVKKRNMKLWIVDDAGYPSGFAGGKFTSEDPELGMQALVEKDIAAKPGSVFHIAVKPETVAVTAINAVSGQSVEIAFTGGSVDWKVPAGTWTVYVVTHVYKTSPTRSDTNPKRLKDGSQTLEDYLDPAATAQYLKFTHEAYKAAVGDEFGKTILGFRGDEPDFSISGLPWTPKFFATFTAIKGYDIRPYLASFLRAKDVKLSTQQLKAEADYYDVFSILFQAGFFKPLGEWCAANHLEYQVHLNHEEAQLQLVRSEGDFLRDMRYMEVPGIDAIWHQIWTDTISDYPRFASSAAHVYGHPRAFTESFAAYRPAPDVTMARYILNEQLVRGVNLVETMYYPASSTPGGGGPDALMRDPAYPALMHYVSRVSYLMSNGKPAASVALLIPTSSLWMGDKIADSMFVSTERLLSEHQIDFDIVNEDAVDKTLRQVPGALETMSGNRYRTVIVPSANVISETTILRLKTLVAGGGHVLFLGTSPTQIAGRTFLGDHVAHASDFTWATINTTMLAPTPTPPAEPPAEAPPAQIVPKELLATLSQVIPAEDLSLTKPNVGLRYTHRTLQGAIVFLLFNESAHAIHDELNLRVPAQSVEVWDPETGERKPASGAVLDRTKVKMPLNLDPYATMIIVVKDKHSDRK